MTSPSPPHSPSSTLPPTSLPPQALQHLADSDHCFPPASPPVLPPLVAAAGASVVRARSGSRTYSEVQEEERRERSRERAAAEDALEGRTSAEGMRDPAGEMSMSELRAEMETLLSLRRRSMSQPATVDPDLPPTAPAASTPPPPPARRPNLTLTITPPVEGPGGALISPTAPSPAETGTLVRRKSSVSGRLPSEHPLPERPPPLPSPPLHLPQHPVHSPFVPSEAAQAPTSQDLFWLPASLHPELAPQEFKAFIREQTRPEALARRSSLTTGGGRVNRRASLLRGEYKPRANDGVGDSDQAGGVGAGGVKRTASDGGSGRGSRMSRNTLNFEELTIKDLQRLEELAAKAEAEGTGDAEGEGERLGRVLRRSLSLNPHRVAAAAAAAGASFPGPLGADATASSDDEAPIIVPPPGQILRRNARTKIRKGPGDGFTPRPGGGSSRFSSRRTRSSTSETGVQLAPAGQAYGSFDDDAMSAGDVSFESGESEDVRAAPRSAEEGVSPPSSDSQHAEVPAPLVPVEAQTIPPAIPHVVLQEPIQEEPEAVDEVAPGYPVVAPVVEAEPVQELETTQPPPRHAISPASAEYDWSTHNLQFQQQPQPPPPAPEPQYTVHPQHSPRQPFSDIPPPQAVPVPLPERKESPSQPPRSDSPRPSVKEKKSGWARLGLGKDDEKKKKGKGKEKDAGAGSGGESSEREKEREKEKEPASSSSSGFFGGLFSRKKSDSDHTPPPAPSPPPEPRLPPPPPTASGALLPNGRYANFYRLPIHVERAVYRLSHIKLANPRRPLYEQVLISNLMFWYLGLIQKPVQPPPAAAPVPVPGMRQQQQQQQAGPSGSATGGHDGPVKEKRGGLSKPNRGGRTAETPVRAPSYEVQNQQLAEEQQHYQQRQLSQSHPQPSSSSSSSGGHSITKSLFAAPLSSSSNEPKQRSPDRSSAPAQMYPFSASAGEDDDDRPLAQFSSGQAQPYRESYPPHRPVPVSTYPKHDAGFQVTSRSPRLSGGGSPVLGNEPHLHPSDSGPSGQGHNRRASAVSDKSFDAGEIYDAYAPGGGNSPGPSPALELAAPPPSSSTEFPFAPNSAPEPAPSAQSKPTGIGALLGTVAPRGSSLKALSGEKGAHKGGIGGGARQHASAPIGDGGDGRGSREYR
ncbi:hypothetical protein JCM10207_009274 [Rhodosporidiobolus poonsookiae]